MRRKLTDYIFAFALIRSMDGASAQLIIALRNSGGIASEIARSLHVAHSTTFP